MYSISVVLQCILLDTPSKLQLGSVILFNKLDFCLISFLITRKLDLQPGIKNPFCVVWLADYLCPASQYLSLYTQSTYWKLSGIVSSKNLWLEKPTKKSISTFHIILWLIGAFLSIPNLLSFKATNKHKFYVQNEGFGVYLLSYRAIVFFIELVFPVFITCIFNIQIIFLMCRKKKTIQKFCKGKTHEIKVIRQIEILIVVFVVSWLLFNVYLVLHMTSYLSDFFN